MTQRKREEGGLGQRDIDALVRAEHTDPFAVLGPHRMVPVASLSAPTCPTL